MLTGKIAAISERLRTATRLTRASYTFVPDINELLDRTLVLVAHPDDETIGCGALLHRIAQPIVVFATNGSPRDPYFWSRFGSRSKYQQLRETEARAALAQIRNLEVEFFGSQPTANDEGTGDQELYLHLDEAYRRTTDILRRTRPAAILTSAYEGGHPDHDCCSILAAHLGAEHKIPVWEFPLYHRARGAITYQQFVDSDPNELYLQLSPRELEQKHFMVRSYTSQHPFLYEFDLTIERFRPQRDYDYSRPPHSGKLNYEAWEWQVRGADVCEAFEQFRANFEIRR